VGFTPGPWTAVIFASGEIPPEMMEAAMLDGEE